MPEEGEEKGKGFKVEDRRRFSPEGELKAEYREEGKRESEEQAAEKRAAEAQEPAGETEEAHIPPTGFEGIPEGITFASFILGLLTQALAFLGEMPNPATGKPQIDLEAAQQIIDILGILREKTRGNLDPEEESLMDEILFDLRMKYVEKARSAPR